MPISPLQTEEFAEYYTCMRNAQKQGFLEGKDLQEQVQFRQPCFVHTPQACSRLFRKA